MKHLMIALACLVPFFASAEVEVNACTSKIYGLKDWHQVAPNVRTCLNESYEFARDIYLLCRKDRRQLSEVFQRYFDLKKKYEDAVVASESSPHDSVLQNNVNQARQNWDLFGHRVKIEALLSELRQVYFGCGGR